MIKINLSQVAKTDTVFVNEQIDIPKRLKNSSLTLVTNTLLWRFSSQVTLCTETDLIST